MNTEKMVVEIFKKQFGKMDVDIHSKFTDMMVDSLSMLSFLITLNEQILPNVNFLMDIENERLETLDDIINHINHYIS